MSSLRSFGNANPRGKRAHLHWRGAIHSVALAQVAFGVFPPGPERAVRLDTHRELIPRVYVRPGRERSHLYRGRARGQRIAFITKAQPAFAVVSPRPQRAVRFNSKGLIHTA